MSIINPTNIPESSEPPVEKTGKKPADYIFLFILVLLSALLNALPFTYPQIWFLTFFCWVPLMIAVKDKSTKVSFLLGVLTGFIGNIVALHWLYNTINFFGHFPVPVSLFFMAVICLFQGARMGFLTLLFSRAVNKGWPLPLCFIMASVASEFLYPTFLPWHNANHVHLIPVLMQLADIGGPVLIGAFLAVPGLAVAELFWARQEKRLVSKGVIFAAVAAPLIMVGYGSYRISYFDRIINTFPSGKVGIYQGNRPMVGDDPVDNLRTYRKASSNMEQIEKLDFIIWPEGGMIYGLREKEISGFYKNNIFNENDRYGRFKINTPLITGGYLYRGEGKDKKLYNIATLVSPDGRIGGIYEKYFLIPFGEYIPFGDVFPYLYTFSPNSLRITPGSHLSTFSFNNHTLTPLICYEDIKTSFANNAIVASNPDLILSFANDGWFGDSSCPEMHFAMAKFRAVEHRRFMVRATNTGISGFVDPVGRTYETTGSSVAGEKIGEIHYMKMSTFYELTGDYPYWLLSIAIILMGFFKRNNLKIQHQEDKNNIA
jgi:apolipoprotein N-acyltransferase